MHWKSRLLVLILCLIGIATSWHLYEVHLEVKYGNFAGGGVCDLSKTVRCDAAAASDYSVVLGLPIAGWGFVFYVFLFFGFALYPIIRKKTWRNFSTLTVLMVTGSVFYSIFLFIVSEWIIGALCPFCVVTLRRQYPDLALAAASSGGWLLHGDV